MALFPYYVRRGTQGEHGGSTKEQDDESSVSAATNLVNGRSHVNFNSEYTIYTYTTPRKHAEEIKEMKIMEERAPYVVLSDELPSERKRH